MSKQIRIAAITPDSVEDMELLVPVDIWKRANFIVDVIVYNTKTSFSLNYSGLRVSSSLKIKDINMVQYDAIFLPGGPKWKDFLNPASIEKDTSDPKLHVTLEKFFNDPEKWIIAICGAPAALMCILDEKARDIKYTCYNSPEVIGDFTQNWLNKKVVIDKQIITGQNAGCSMELAFAVIEKLAGIELAKQLAGKLLYNYEGTKQETE
nr:DJ-1/PfpI family protein [Mycoplasma haemocanis]